MMTGRTFYSFKKSAVALVFCCLLAAVLTVNGFSVPRPITAACSIVETRSALLASKSEYDLDLSDVDFTTPTPGDNRKKSKLKKPVETSVVKKAEPSVGEGKAKNNKKKNIPKESQDPLEFEARKESKRKTKDADRSTTVKKTTSKGKDKSVETATSLSPQTSSSGSGTASPVALAAAGFGGLAAFRSQLEKSKNNR